MAVKRVKLFFHHAVKYVKAHPLRTSLIGVAVLFIAASVYSLWPRTVQFVYSGDNCISHIMLAPSLVRADQNDTYEVTPEGGVAIAGVPLFSTQLCATATQAPSGDSELVRLSAFGVGIPFKSVTIIPEELPQLSSDVLLAPIPASRPIALSLSAPDTTFTYVVKSGDKQVSCDGETAAAAVECQVADLSLQQGEKEDIIIDRYFKDTHVGTVVDTMVEVLPAVKVTKSSINRDDTVYSKPKTIELDVDKTVTAATATLVYKEGDKETEIPAEVTAKNKKIILQLQDDLPREAEYELRMTDVAATDGSSLAGDYIVPFKVSGGPKVASVSVGTSRVSPNAQIILALDQEIKADEDIAKYAAISGVAGAISKVDAKTIAVQLNGADRCAPFAITIKKGILSKYDIAATADWKFSSRVQCYTLETIGYSAQGRAINAYYYGNGSRTVLYTGGIHGNEISSTYTMQSFMSDLESNPDRIPSGVQVVVVPSVSPDGVAAGTRDNARGVNLNRNFSTGNWESDITVSGGGTDKGGGGGSAGSEPETKALMNLTARIGPSMVVTHHSQGSLVNSNDVGNSITAGQDYARRASYRFIPNSATSATFGFTMTGTYEDWLLERGTPAILIELDGHYGNYYARNSGAMWAMLGY